MQHSYPAWVGLCFSRPPNISYSLDGVDFVKIFRIYTLICKKITIEIRQLHSQQNSVAGLTFADLFHDPCGILGIAPLHL